MNTCQSCAFMLAHLTIDICLAKEVEYSDGTFKEQTRFGKLRAPFHLTHNWHATSSIVMGFVGYK
jgi:hypothetical protein